MIYAGFPVWSVFLLALALAFFGPVAFLLGLRCGRWLCGRDYSDPDIEDILRDFGNPLAPEEEARVRRDLGTGGPEK